MVIDCAIPKCARRPRLAVDNGRAPDIPPEANPPETVRVDATPEASILTVSELGSEPVSPPSPVSKTDQSESAKANGRILVLDDESAIADTLGMIFAAQRYQVRVAYSAEKAIEIIAEWRPDLAILDVMLPGMNGIDLAIAIKANYSACHVLLFSGNTNTTALLEEAGKEGHHFEVLPKPLHPSLMLEKVADLLSSTPEPPALD
jgi:CheY-like chemotaxis protein